MNGPNIPLGNCEVCGKQIVDRRLLPETRLKVFRHSRVLIMTALCHEHRLSTGELGRVLGIPYASLTNDLRALEREGYVWFRKRNRGKRPEKIWLPTRKAVYFLMELGGCVENLFEEVRSTRPNSAVESKNLTQELTSLFG